jgi:phosphoenolpyruvate carboxykinase (ATP)
MFGTILENVVVDPAARTIDLNDDSITENTRASYPIDYIPNHVPEGHAGQPQNIVFLTADAFGVLPPIAKLTPAQARYHFLSGYTAKVAGTERGVTEPQATFSTCFGAPFLPLRPSVYATMLGERIARHGVQCWLINTGWTGGPHGVGSRMSLPYTRAMVHAALDGSLTGVSTKTHPVFGLEMPTAVPDVPEEVLDPRQTWKDPVAYDAAAAELAGMFHNNFEQFAADVDDEVRSAGPNV